MDINKEREAFQKFLEVNFDFENHEYTYFDEQTQRYENDHGEDTDLINIAWSAWQAAKASTVPEGFVLVPKEPTEEIINAMHDSFLGAFIEGKATGGQSIEFAYKAMIEAAQGEGHE